MSVPKTEVTAGDSIPLVGPVHRPEAIDEKPSCQAVDQLKWLITNMTLLLVVGCLGGNYAVHMGIGPSASTPTGATALLWTLVNSNADSALDAVSHLWPILN
jgi:hypothetical protein